MTCTLYTNFVNRRMKATHRWTPCLKSLEEVAWLLVPTKPLESQEFRSSWKRPLNILTFLTPMAWCAGKALGGLLLVFWSCGLHFFFGRTIKRAKVVDLIRMTPFFQKAINTRGWSPGPNDRIWLTPTFPSSNLQASQTPSKYPQTPNTCPKTSQNIIKYHKISQTAPKHPKNTRPKTPLLRCSKSQLRPFGPFQRPRGAAHRAEWLYRFGHREHLGGRWKRLEEWGAGQTDATLENHGWMGFFFLLPIGFFNVFEVPFFDPQPTILI